MKRGELALLWAEVEGSLSDLDRVVEEIDQSVPTGSEWHRALLRRMATDVKGIRPAVLSSETLEKLLPYLGFRHFFRHSYTFEIDWEKLKPLVMNVRSVLESFERDLKGFFNKYPQERGRQ